MSNKKPGQSGQPDFVPFALAINVKWLLEYHENEFLLSLFCSTRINPISVIKCSGFRCHDPGITIFTNFFFSLPLAFNIIKTRPAPDRYNINTVFLRVKSISHDSPLTRVSMTFDVNFVSPNDLPTNESSPKCQVQIDHSPVYKNRYVKNL